MFILKIEASSNVNTEFVNMLRYAADEIEKGNHTVDLRNEIVINGFLTILEEDKKGGDKL